VLDLLRGMLAGMGGFVAFCEVIAVMIVPAGVWPSFSAGSVAAVLVQAMTALGPGPAPGPQPEG
jgi:hypothetical protein